MRRWLKLTLPLAIGFIAALMPASLPLEEPMAVMRDGWRGHAAGKGIVVVEIDAASIAHYGRWPWPRRWHAALVDQLDRAGARSIVFDVDFSAPSDPAEDQIFARAVQRSAGNVVLATFRQRAREQSETMTESLPIPALREHSLLASVNVHPDADGNLRRYPAGSVTAGVPRPSLAATIAGRGGVIGGDFMIDRAIDPDSFRRLSFADVAAGKFGAEAVRGKHVLIGATAIELGDRYAVPGHGLVAGVVAHAMAAETLRTGADLPDAGPWPLLALALALIALAGRFSQRQAMLILGGGALVSALAVPLASEALLLARLEIVPAACALIAAMAARAVARITGKLRQARYQDSETALPNAAALARARQSKEAESVAVITIDRFDDLVATLSVPQRRQFLELIADRIRNATGSAAVYRVDRSSFGWSTDIWTDAASPRIEAAIVAVGARVSLGGHEAAVRANAGLASALACDGRDPLLCALQAASLAQRTGALALDYHADMAAASERVIAMLADLDAALDAAAFRLVYQPKLDLKSGAVAGFEALVRWHHPRWGEVSPASFVPMIEAEGWDERLARCVITLALADMTGWQAEGCTATVAVNVSASLLVNRIFCGELVGAVADSAVTPAQMAIEVTESAVLGDHQRSAEALTALRAQSFRVAIDDYGTGQSTLSYLQQLPADEIKIDQSFIRNITTRRSDQILVRSTIELAHEMGMKVVAEGIEDQATLDALAQLACDVGQGFFISRPLAADQVPMWRYQPQDTPHKNAA